MSRLTPPAQEKPTSIHRYLAGRAAVVLVLMLAVAGISIAALAQIENSSVGLAGRYLPRFKAAIHLSMDANAATALNVRMAGASSQAERRSLVDRLTERHRAMEEHILQLGEIGASDETVAAVRRLRDSLMDGALALSAIAQESINLRAVPNRDAAERLAELDRRRQNLLLRQQDLASELAGFVTALTTDAERRFDEQRREADAAVLRNLILVSLCGAGAVAAVAWMYGGVRRRVIGRVLELRDVLQGWRGGPAVLPKDGNDEITRMTETLQDLLDAVNERTQALEDLASIDSLTGLSNRRHFSRRADEEIRRACRYGTPVSAIIGDLDHFKAINDGWGHEIGDLALVQTARIWRETLRDVDLSARFGGEEFVALLPESTLAAAAAAADRIREQVAVAKIAAGGDVDLSATISLGAAQMQAGEDLAGLLRRADQAMYRAKNQGRNTVCVAE